MNLVLTRTSRNPLAVRGDLTVNGIAECVTLENPALLIPAGSYPVVVYSSPRLGHTVPLLVDVPGRTMIEIHCGNKAEDSLGCILVGRTGTPDRISESRLAFAHLMPQIQAAFDSKEAISIDVRDNL